MSSQLEKEIRARKVKPYSGYEIPPPGDRKKASLEQAVKDRQLRYYGREAVPEITVKRIRGEIPKRKTKKTRAREKAMIAKHDDLIERRRLLQEGLKREKNPARIEEDVAMIEQLTKEIHKLLMDFARIR